MKIANFILVIVLLSGSLLMAQDKKKTNIAVMPLRGSSISETDAQFLTDRLVIELQQTDVFDVLERDKMNEILKEQGFQQTGACDETSCLVEAGKLLPVEKIIGGSVGKLGDTYSVQIRLIDIKTGRVNKSACRDFSQKMDYLLTQGMKQAAFDVAGIKSIEIQEKTIPDSSAIILDSAFAYVVKAAYQGKDRYEMLIQKKKGGSKLLISKGSSQGAYEGQLLVVKRINEKKSIIDPINKAILKSVIDIVAEIEIIKVDENYSECIVRKSNVQLVIGDRLFLKP